jgi:anaerobic selenocysteine-containing dehydrogenase
MLCSMGCQVNLNVSGDKITCTTPHNSQLCVRGRFGIAPLVNHPKRITAPLMKKGDAVVEVEWDEALAFVAGTLKDHKNHTGILLTPELTSEALNKIYSLADQGNMKIAIQLDPGNMPQPLNLTRARGKLAFIVLNTDLVADYSILLLALRKKFKHNAAFIVIDPVAGRSNRFADAVLTPIPGKENDVMQMLHGSKKKKNKTGITATEIEAARRLIAGRKVFVLYDPSNTPLIKIKKPFIALPLHSKSNMLTIERQGYDITPEQLLVDEHVDCLYAIGCAPDVNRKYSKVIVQDCFLPDSEFDVFLPAATFAETSGNVMDLSGRLKKVRAAVAPAGKAMPDGRIIHALARAMNIKLKKRTQKRKPKRTRQLRSSRTSSKYPLNLIVRQNTYGYRNTTLSAILKGFDRLREDRRIWLNERTAARYGLKKDMEATLTGSFGTHTARIKFSPSVPDGAVLIFRYQSTRNFADGPVRIECTK